MGGLHPDLPRQVTVNKVLGMFLVRIFISDLANMLQLILPFTIAIYLIFTHQYMLDPIIALVGYSEYTFFDFYKIREPFVRKTLNRRSLTVLVMFVLLTAAICCLFILVPGKRL